MFFRNDDKKDPKSKGGVRTVPLLPLRDIIVFPHMVVPLFVGREKSIAALEEAMSHDKDILLAAQKKAKTNEPSPDDIFEIGTLGTILQLLRLPDGTVKVLVEGKKRARVRRYASQEKFFLVEAEEVEEFGALEVALGTSDERHPRAAARECMGEELAETAAGTGEHHPLPVHVPDSHGIAPGAVHEFLVEPAGQHALAVGRPARGEEIAAVDLAHVGHRKAPHGRRLVDLHRLRGPIADHEPAAGRID